MNTFDCIVVGSGHAGSCAALSAVEHGCNRVLIVEKASASWVGGNGYFTAGAHRTAHGGLCDLLPIVVNVTPEMAERVDVEAYSEKEFAEDILRVGGGRSDREMVKTVVKESRETIEWLKNSVNVPFTLSFDRQAYEVNGRQKFWGGMALSVEGGGKGLIRAHQSALKRAGVDVWCECPVVQLALEGTEVTGVVVEKQGQRVTLTSQAVVLACGGFEASSVLRVKYLGSSWAKAKVRSAQYFQADMI
jgi:succinate dehydrogenase/fumarate reductase flavoprotein subunit